MSFIGRKKQSGFMASMQEPDNRFYRRHGRYSELEFRSSARKIERNRKLAENPRLVRFHFLHHNL